jgi:cytochrome c oxidase subunit 1
MTTTQLPIPAPTQGAARFLARPRATTGAWSWFTTPDHKKIAIMYGTTAILFFLAGGIEALLIRIQLARPNGTFLSAGAYNQLFTMHGTTVVFLLGMPIAAAFGNYLIPLMIGATSRSRLNIFGYWSSCSAACSSIRRSSSAWVARTAAGPPR